MNYKKAGFASFKSFDNAQYSVNQSHGVPLNIRIESEKTQRSNSQERDSQDYVEGSHYHRAFTFEPVQDRPPVRYLDTQTKSNLVILDNTSGFTPLQIHSSEIVLDQIQSKSKPKKEDLEITPKSIQKVQMKGSRKKQADEKKRQLHSRNKSHGVTQKNQSKTRNKKAVKPSHNRSISLLTNCQRVNSPGSLTPRSKNCFKKEHIQVTTNRSRQNIKLSKSSVENISRNVGGIKKSRSTKRSKSLKSSMRTKLKKYDLPQSPSTKYVDTSNKDLTMTNSLVNTKLSSQLKPALRQLHKERTCSTFRKEHYQEVSKLQNELVKCRSKVYESEYKVKALKDKLKQAKVDVDRANQIAEQNAQEKHDFMQNYQLVLDKLSQKDNLVTSRQLELIQSLRQMIQDPINFSRSQLLSELDKIEDCIRPKNSMPSTRLLHSENNGLRKSFDTSNQTTVRNSSCLYFNLGKNQSNMVVMTENSDKAKKDDEEAEQAQSPSSELMNIKELEPHNEEQKDPSVINDQSVISNIKQRQDLTTEPDNMSPDYQAMIRQISQMQDHHKILIQTNSREQLMKDIPDQLEEALNRPMVQSRADSHIQQKTASFHNGRNTDLMSPEVNSKSMTMENSIQQSQREFQKSIMNKLKDYENSLNLLRQQNQMLMDRQTHMSIYQTKNVSDNAESGFVGVNHENQAASRFQKDDTSIGQRMEISHKQLELHIEKCDTPYDSKEATGLVMVQSESQHPQASSRNNDAETRPLSKFDIKQTFKNDVSSLQFQTRQVDSVYDFLNRKEDTEISDLQKLNAHLKTDLRSKYRVSDKSNTCIESDTSCDEDIDQLEQNLMQKLKEYPISNPSQRESVLTNKSVGYALKQKFLAPVKHINHDKISQLERMISEKKKSTETDSSKTKTIREMSIIGHEEQRQNYLANGPLEKMSSQGQMTSSVSRTMMSQPKLENQSSIQSNQNQVTSEDQEEASLNTQEAQKHQESRNIVNDIGMMNFIQQMTADSQHKMQYTHGMQMPINCNSLNHPQASPMQFKSPEFNPGIHRNFQVPSSFHHSSLPSQPSNQKLSSFVSPNMTGMGQNLPQVSNLQILDSDPRHQESFEKEISQTYYQLRDGQLQEATPQQYIMQRSNQLDLMQQMSSQRQQVQGGMGQPLEGSSPDYYFYPCQMPTSLTPMISSSKRGRQHYISSGEPSQQVFDGRYAVPNDYMINANQFGILEQQQMASTGMNSYTTSPQLVNSMKRMNNPHMFAQQCYDSETSPQVMRNNPQQVMQQMQYQMNNTHA